MRLLFPLIFFLLFLMPISLATTGSFVRDYTVNSSLRFGFNFTNGSFTYEATPNNADWDITDVTSAEHEILYAVSFAGNSNYKRMQMMGNRSLDEVDCSSEYPFVDATYYPDLLTSYAIRHYVGQTFCVKTHEDKFVKFRINSFEASTGYNITYEYPVTDTNETVTGKPYYEGYLFRSYENGMSYLRSYTGLKQDFLIYAWTNGQYTTIDFETEDIPSNQLFYSYHHQGTPRNNIYDRGDYTDFDNIKCSDEYESQQYINIEENVGHTVCIYTEESDFVKMQIVNYSAEGYWLRFEQYESPSVDANITNVIYFNQSKLNDVQDIVVTIKNIGNQTHNFIIGLSIGIENKMWCNHLCYGEGVDIDGMKYFGQALLSPNEEMSISSSFIFKDNFFEVNKTYNIWITVRRDDLVIVDELTIDDAITIYSVADYPSVTDEGADVIAGLLGTSRELAYAFLAIIISIIIGTIVAVKTKDGVMGAISLLAMIILFSMLGWLPIWFIILLAVISAFLITKFFTEHFMGK